LALLALLSSACGSSSEPGVTLRVVSRPFGLEAGESLENDLGHSFALETALFTNLALEILPCKSAFRSLWDAAVPNARAHGVSTPTRLAVPIVEDAFSTEAVELGELSPPAARYCALVLEFGPADSDAEGLDRAPEALGKSLLLRGSAGADVPFAIESSMALESTREIEISLDDSQREITLVVEHDARRWFDGVDLSSHDGAELEQRLLENLERSIAVHVD
jgi:hypothetical protein